jgi:hypothetical protein
MFDFVRPDLALKFDLSSMLNCSLNLFNVAISSAPQPAASNAFTFSGLDKILSRLSSSTSNLNLCA